MNALVGTAQQEDDEFWNSGMFAEADNDDSFGSNDHSSGQDSFDEDFG